MLLLLRVEDPPPLVATGTIAVKVGQRATAHGSPSVREVAGTTLARKEDSGPCKAA